MTYIKDRRLTDFYIQQVTNDVAARHITVVNRMNNDLQEKLLTMASANRESKREERENVFVIHNFRDIETINDLHEAI